MVLWKKREHKVPENQSTNDPATVDALRNYGLLKNFWIPWMKAHVLDLYRQNVDSYHKMLLIRVPHVNNVL